MNKNIIKKNNQAIKNQKRTIAEGNKYIKLVDSITKIKNKDPETNETYQVSLLPGLKKTDITNIENNIGCKFPKEIKELLQYTQGIDLGWNDIINFTGIEFEGIDHEEIFPLCISLRHDGAGNYCIVDINPKNGKWGQIYYYCHEPAVVMLHAKDLKEFLEKLKKNLKKGGEYDLVDFDAAYKIRLNSKKETNKNKKLIKEFGIKNIDFDYNIVDFTSAKNGEGFYRGSFKKKIIRHKQKPIFIVEFKKDIKRRRQFRENKKTKK